MRPNLTHIALHVINFDECVEFYKNYCQLKTIHHRETKKTRIVWLAEQGRETDLIFVLISGGINRDPGERDFGHLGFAVDSKRRPERISWHGASERRVADAGECSRCAIAGA